MDGQIIVQGKVECNFTVMCVFFTVLHVNACDSILTTFVRIYLCHPLLLHIYIT